MQFRVPQNIDLEDKIVGPLTLIQFIYIISGGLIDYILFQSIGQFLAIYLIIALPIALLALALAFLKIQDQPLSHFIQAGLLYLRQPKLRFWQRTGIFHPVIIESKKPVQKEARPVMKKIDQSNLERLAYVLDTRPQAVAEDKNFGKITQSFEKLFKTGYLKVETPKGGKHGAVGQAQKTTNLQHPGNS